MYKMGFPRKVHSGIDCIEKLPEILKEEGVRQILVMTDEGVYAQKAFQNVMGLLRDYRVECIHDIPPEPTVYDIQRVYECANGFGAEAVVAVGGGSVMDMTKMIAACLTNPEYARDVQKTEEIRKAPALTVMIPTTAGRLCGFKSHLPHDFKTEL